MLQPARRKFRKEQKGRNTGVATRGANVSFGEFGLKATERGRITARQIEAARRAISRHIKRGGRIFIRIFPDKPISQKPARVLRGRDRSRQGAVRAERCTGSAGSRGFHARRCQAAVALHIRHASNRHLNTEQT